MKSTSPSSSWVRMAARSPARSSAGPEVMCRPTPISVATMPASVVLPRPGGPANSRWSAAWPRRRAASRMMPRCSLSSRLADELVERRGGGGRPRRRSGLGTSVRRRSARRAAGAPVVGRELGRRAARRGPSGDAARRCRAARSSVGRVGARRAGRASASRDLVGPVAEAGERLADVGAGRRGGRAPARARRRCRPGPTGRGRAGRGGTSARPAGGPRSSCRRRARGTARRRRRRRAPGAARRRVHRRGWPGPAPGRRRGRRAAPRSTTRSSRGGEAVERLGVLADVVVDVEEDLVAELAELDRRWPG